MGMPSLPEELGAAGKGRKLPAGLGRALERGLGADLSEVRVHTGPAADRLSRMLNADAFACGSGIFFRDGAYQPGSLAGAWLIAHEAAHVVQQARGAVGGAAFGDVTVSTPADPWEREADRLADRVLAGLAQPGRPAGAVTAAPQGRALAVQRHSSFEHRYLGDGPTSDLVAVSGNAPGRQEILETQIKLAGLWQTSPEKVTEEDVWDVYHAKTLHLGPDRLLVTYGELNALPDYLASAAALDEYGEDILMPILQVIRQETYNQLTLLATGKNPLVTFERAASPPWANGMIHTILETTALDKLTWGLGVRGEDHYQGLLARNACHFAPFSWHRWQASHLIARDLAWKYYNTSDPEFARGAWVYHGYADHFLQDSFAAGHLVNKTLVMQWFIEWAAEQSLMPVADWDAIKTMTEARQPGLAGRPLYDLAFPWSSNDPQTAQEAALLVERILGGGVVADAPASLPDSYQNYLTFLASAAAQMGSAVMHDYYNTNSLWVSSAAQPAPYEIWGDDTLLGGASGANGVDGVRATSETAQRSQRALGEILDNGTTDITMASIRGYFPARAGTSRDNVQDLQAWAASADHKTICMGQFDMRKALLLSLVSPRLGVVSRDHQFAVSWSASLPESGFTPVETVCPPAGGLVAGSSAQVYWLDPQRGTVLSSLKLLDSLAGPVHLASHPLGLIAGPADSSVRAIQDGKELWTRQLPDDSHAETDVAADGSGRIFAGTNGYVYELNPKDGTVLQNLRLTSPVGGDVTRLLPGGMALIAGVNGYVYAVDLATWKQAWQRSLPGCGYHEVNITATADGGRLFAGCNGYVYELNPKDGTVLQNLRLTSPVGGDVTRVATDGTALFAGVHGYVYAVTLSSWQKYSWAAPMKGLTYQAVDVAAAGGRLFAGSNGYACQLDPVHGTMLHSRLLTLPAGIGNFQTRLAVPGGPLMYAGVHGYVNGIVSAPLAVTADGLAGWWPLNGSGRGLAGTLNDMTADATVKWDPDRFGHAVLNGTGAYLSTAGPVLDTSASFTVTAWVKLDGQPRFATAVSQDGRQVSAFYLQYVPGATVSDGRWAFARLAADLDGAAPTRALSAQPPAAGQWTHLAGVYDHSAGQLALYVNGTSAGAAAFTAGWNSSGAFQVGRAKAPSGPVDFFPGSIGEVRAYNRCLSGTEIASAAHLTDGLTARFPLDEGTGTTAADAIVPGRIATGKTAWAPGISGNCVQLNGVDGWLSVPQPVVKTSSSFTVSAWVRLEAQPGRFATALSQDGQQVSAFYLQYIPEYEVSCGRWAFARLAADLPGGQPTRALSAQPPATGQWTHLAGVSDAEAGTIRLYVNGVPTGRPQPFKQGWDSAGGFQIGRATGPSGPVDFFPGSIDEVRVYQRALSDTEVSLLA